MELLNASDDFVGPEAVADELELRDSDFRQERWFMLGEFFEEHAVGEIRVPGSLRERAQLLTAISTGRMLETGKGSKYGAPIGWASGLSAKPAQ